MPSLRASVKGRPARGPAMPLWPPPLYQIRATFRVPLPFAYRWCTDYRPQDSKLAGEHYERRIILRSARRVLFEDLWWESDGWRWRRYDVTLHPPNRWSADSVGNVRDAAIQYRLTALAPEKTALDLTLRRRPGARGGRQPSKAAMEAELRSLWSNFGRELEADYRRSKLRRRAR